MKRFYSMLVLLALGALLAAFPAWAEELEDAATDVAPHRVEEGSGHDAQSSHDEHGADHVPHFSDINWWNGLIGEKEGVSPSLLWRPPGTPIPLGALLLNTAILFFLIGRFGGPGIRQGLVDRKKRIAGDIERAAEMRREAEGQLAHYEEKLAQMEAEMARIKKEMKEQAELDRGRAIEEATARRLIIEQESKTLIEHELSQARLDATMNAVSGAISAAREEVRRSLNQQDHERLSHDLLGGLEAQMKKSTEARS